MSRYKSTSLVTKTRQLKSKSLFQITHSTCTKTKLTLSLVNQRSFSPRCLRSLLHSRRMFFCTFPLAVFGSSSFSFKNHNHAGAF